MRAAIFLLFFTLQALGASFSVATFNLEFYVDAPTLGRNPKSEESKRAIASAIAAMNPDVIALQEMGSTNALLELRARLQRAGVNYPHWEHVRAWDANLHLAFLSKLPIVARRHHTNESFLLNGRRFRVTRGFGEIDVEVDRRKITLLSAHLKSKRQTGEADQQEWREEEALLLREKIDAFFKRVPNGRLIVLGDLNDGISSRSTRGIMGRGNTRLFDTRPGEPGGAEPNRSIVWTHFYAAEEIFSRIDYILASPALRRGYRPERSRVHASPEWGVASDHRPVLAVFELN
jgi:endonuclease/exonuclease/phosphatase family metal-dependent hydrolase